MVTAVLIRSLNLGPMPVLTHIKNSRLGNYYMLQHPFSNFEPSFGVFLSIFFSREQTKKLFFFITIGEHDWFCQKSKICTHLWAENNFIKTFLEVCSPRVMNFFFEKMTKNSWKSCCQQLFEPIYAWILIFSFMERKF